MFSYWLILLVHCVWVWHNVTTEEVVTKGPITVCSGASASIKYPGTCGGAAVVDMKSFSHHHPQKSEAAEQPEQPEHPEHPKAGTLLDDEEAHSKTAWSYRETAEAYGPHNWYKVSPTCNGPNQSPIDIITANALEMGIESPIEISMDDPTGRNIIEGRLINNGKTIEFELNNNSPPVVFSGEMTDGEGYLLKQLHLHFGCGIKTGSEHSIDGYRYSGEMHMVFKNMKYGHPEVAMRKKDGLVILAFFLQVRPNAEPNLAFEKISNNIVYVQFPKQKAPVRGGLSITELVPLLKHGLVNLKRYVYKGSLPTPPCYESVTWVVFHRPINIRTNKLSGGVFGEPKGLMCGNYRPTKKLKERHVFKYTIPASTAFTTPIPNTGLQRFVKTTRSATMSSANILGIDNDGGGALQKGTTFTEVFREVFNPTRRVFSTFNWELSIEKPAVVVNENAFIESLPTPPTTTTTTTTTTTLNPLQVIYSLIGDLENDKRRYHHP